jgi:hypothetical protein
MLKRFALAIIVAGLLVATTGCEVVMTAFVEKDWRTDPSLYTGNDMKTRVEIKTVHKIEPKK